MKKHYLFSIILLSIISTTSVLATNPTKINKIKYTQNEVIVKYKKGISIEKAKSLARTKNFRAPKVYKSLSAKNNQAFVVIQGDISTEMLIKQLKEDPNIESVSPNYIRTLSKLPNDSEFEELWGLNNTGREVHGETGIANVDINAPEAWETTTGSKNIVVAVFDTGVDYNHQDLNKNMWNNPNDPLDGEDNDGNGYTDDYYGIDVAADSEGYTTDGDPMDIDGHGTHVAGTIGADGNNTIGSTGVNWNVGIMAIKVFRPSDDGELGTYDEDILEAIDYVLEKKTAGVNIVAVNASYGGDGGSQDDAMNTAIKSLGNAGIIFCTAAGNNGSDNDNTPQFPASYNATNIISVAATDQNGELASFSNFGVASVDLSAPGVNIYSTVPDNLYAYEDGTSMATSHVTGAVALLASIDNDLNASERKNIILDSAKYIDEYNGKILTSGLLNLETMLATLTINHAPNGINDSASTTINTSIVIDVLANDRDINYDELSIKENSITSFSNGGDASLSNNKITYTPAQDFTGIETFTYIPTDNTADGTPTTVTVSVNEITSTTSSSGGGGGCTYNPDNKSFDLMFILMMISLFYPLKRKYLS